MRPADCDCSSFRGVAIARIAVLASVAFAAFLALASHPSFAGDAEGEMGVPAPILQAQILLTGGDTPPPDGAPWQPQSLPDDWSRTRPQIGGDAWYRIEFELPPDRVMLSVVYVPRLSMTGAPFVNGVRIGTLGRLAEPMTRLWYRPQLHWIPETLLKPGRNLLHYRTPS